jgi:acyl-coenzyme A thioesterase PaaI-like protein
MSAPFASLDPNAVARVRASFARQGAMATLGADISDVAAGRVTITLAVEPRLSQQDGFGECPILCVGMAKSKERHV